MNQNYINNYIEVMTGIMQDAVLRNISLQANEKISNDVIQEQAKKIEELQLALDNNSKSESKLHTELENIIVGLKSELSSAHNVIAEYDSVKHQVQHVETFRNELVNERNAHEKTRNLYESKIKDLQKQIDYLQLTPAQKKKISESTVVKKTKVSTEEPTKDGGKF